MKVSVKVPATSANLGPGFDSFGIALPLYNTVTIEELVDPMAGIEINVFSNSFDIGDFHIPTDTNNIVYKAVDLLFTYIGQTPHSMRININTDIPIAKGFGSSASVIVGGLIATNELLGNPADEAALISIANEIEGHPDNIAPAILGGFVVASSEDDGRVITRKIPWPDEWKIMMCIPDFELSTSISRSVLPDMIPLKDAAFNSRKAAMMIQAINLKDEELMKAAMQDKLHQPYRMKFVPGLDEIMNAMQQYDYVLGTALSGAGPGVIVISSSKDTDELKNTIKEIWSGYQVKAEMKTVSVEENGATFI